MAFSIKGKVLDENSDPMMQASVRVLKADSTLVKGVLTNENGAFTVSGLNSGNYIVETSFVGYDNHSCNVRISKADVTLQPITMQAGALMLREAQVVGVRTPVKVMQDTVEYNADAYRTQPNAVVEDLLKRLPGVEVDSEGKITANGKSVTKILIDGKEFFADDPTVASRNLPVDMVDKLQVVDRKSDLARITGVDDGEEETVINLTVKKGMNNGWFGNAEAGYGTDDRYKANFIVNRFWNGNQITLLGNFNNVNELGFNDGMSGRFRRFGGDNGITTSQALGLNFNIGNKEIFRVGGNLMYNHTDRDTQTSSARTYIFPDSSSYYDT
ncbi:MAG: TonB-dependent receptor, partial [Muribaculaceae bacterium]|nr:TonB-dependent receptor [Muribaculaceae bacterium]